MYKNFNRFIPLLSVLAVGTIPLVAWRKNVNNYEQIRERITKPSVDFELPRNSSSYPWAEDMDKWEGTKIKMEGYYEEERFLVSREKDGKKGYLVFAPFVYRHKRQNKLDRGGRSYRQFVIVNLGWIPVHLKDTISMNYDQTNLVEYSEQTHPGFLNINDGFERDPESESGYMPLTYVTGIIRKGETKDVTRGLNNWPRKNYFRMIDLFYMSKIFRLPNVDKASQAYIQQIAQTQEQQQNIPIPNTAQNIEHQYAASKVPYFRWVRQNLLSPTLQVVGKVIV